MAITWHRLEAGPHEPVLGDDLVQRVGLREELGLAGRHDDLAGDRQAGEARDGGRRHGLNSGSEEQASSGVDASCCQLGEEQSAGQERRSVIRQHVELEASWW